MPAYRSRFQPMDDDGVALDLDDDERAVLGRVLDELRGALLSEGQPVTWRLFPSAHRHDEAAEQEWQRLVHDDLLAARLAGIEVVERTLADGRASWAELDVWLTTCNALRLVLGTSLDITDDDVDGDEIEPDDPQAMAWAVYGWLALLVDNITHVLSGRLPPPAEER